MRTEIKNNFRKDFYGDQVTLEYKADSKDRQREKE